MGQDGDPPPLSLDNAITEPLFALGRPNKFRRAHGERSPEIRNRCIVDLVNVMNQAAPKWDIRNAGANALTLALLCNAPLKFIAQLLTVAIEQYPAIANQADAANRTPMMIAIERGDDKLVSLLLKNGACASSPLLLEAALDQCVTTGQPQLLKQIAQISDNRTQTLVRVIDRRIGMLLTGDSTALNSLLEAVHPMLSDDDIVALLIAAAQVPGATEKLPVLYGSLRKPMTSDQLETLREAAADAGDLANYRYVRQLDKLLAETLNSPSSAASPLLQRELVRALHVNDDDFVNILLAKGVNAVFQEEDYKKISSEEAFTRMLMLDRTVQENPGACEELVASAVYKNYAACVDYLLQKGAPAGRTLISGFSSMDGFQPIAIAVKNENLEIARALLSAGAVPSSYDVTAARFSPNPEFRRLFRSFKNV